MTSQAVANPAQALGEGHNSPRHQGSGNLTTGEAGSSQANAALRIPSRHSAGIGRIV